MSARVFYVCVIDGRRTGLLRGPFATHEEALSLVEPVRRWVKERNDWAHFYAFGTASIVSDFDSAPAGRLNDAMTEVPA